MIDQLWRLIATERLARRHRGELQTVGCQGSRGLAPEAGRALSFLTRGGLVSRTHGRSEHYIEAGIEYCEEHDLDSFRPYLLAVRGELQLRRGRWIEAGESLAMVLARRGYGRATDLALVTLGRLRARRGDPEQWALLDEALPLARRSGEPWLLAAVAVGRAEAAWLEGRHERVAEETHTALELALQRGASHLYGELLYWRWRAGIPEQVPPGAHEPYAAQLAGDWARAAEQWTQLGCPYEAALALADADEEEPLRQAYEQLQALGAAPAAAIVARRLRERGERGLPRGPRPSTRRNVANLTERETEVLKLLAQGLRNAEIAERLVVSQKTVHHHVSAILRKLDMRTRTKAGAEAVRLGLTDPR